MINEPCIHERKNIFGSFLRKFAMLKTTFLVQVTRSPDWPEMVSNNPLNIVTVQFLQQHL